MEKKKLKGFSIKSIKMKLVISFSVLILLATVGIGIISIQQSSKALTAAAERSVQLSAQDAAKFIESKIDIQKKIIEMLSVREDIQTMNWTVQQRVLQQQLDKTGFLDMAIVTPNGTATYSDGSTSQLGDRFMGIWSNNQSCYKH